MSNTDNPDKSLGVYIHDVSVRSGSQLVAVESLEKDEVLSKAELQLSATVGGKVPGGCVVFIKQYTRGFIGTFKDSYDTSLPKSNRFSIQIRLKNGLNRIIVKIQNNSGQFLCEKVLKIYYKDTFREWNETIFIAFFLALIIRGLVIQAFWIPTGSMEPTLLGEHPGDNFTAQRSGDRILVSRFAYVLDFSLDGRIPFLPRVWIKKPQRGDIIVFKFPNPHNDPEHENKDYIKRVIGLPGDEVIMRNGEVRINGQLIDEPYICEPAWHNMQVKVPEDHLFVVGDNRNNSSDSREWGSMHIDNLKGQAIFNYLPLNRFSPIRSHLHILKKDK